MNNQSIQKKTAGKPAEMNANGKKAADGGKGPSDWAKDLKIVSDAVNTTANTGLDFYNKVTSRIDQQDKQIIDRNARQFDELKGILVMASKDGKTPWREQLATRTELIAARNTEEMRLRKNEAEIRHLRSKTRLKNAGAGCVWLSGTSLLLWGVSKIIKALKCAA